MWSLFQAPNDPKALFRRCQAYEALNQVDSAYKDAREVHRVDPNNKAIQPVLVRLHKAVSEKVSHVTLTLFIQLVLNLSSSCLAERALSDRQQSEEHV